MGMVPPRIIPRLLRSREVQLKQEHLSAFPDMPAYVDENIEAPPVAFTEDERVIYPPQGPDGSVTYHSPVVPDEEKEEQYRRWDGRVRFNSWENFEVWYALGGRISENDRVT